MDWILQSGDMEWLNRFKKRIQLCAAYLRLTLGLRAHRLKLKGYSMQMETKKNGADYAYIRQKASVHQGVITFVNIYASNIGAPKHIKQLLTGLKE